jgi:ribosomal protein S18 acetylase RimI-like enzyme
MNVRRARPGDAEAIRRVARVAWHETYDDVLSAGRIDELVDDWYATDELVDDVGGPDPVVVAEFGSDVGGFAHARADDDGVEAELVRIYVHPDHWGAGAGSAMLDAVCDPLERAGVERLRAVVAAANGVGRRFYERRGFAVRERRETELEGAAFEVLVVALDLPSR